MGRAIGTVDVATIAAAADERLGATVWVRAQKQPGLRKTTLVATAAPLMRPPMAWTRALATAMMPLQSCLCTVWGEAGQGSNGQAVGMPDEGRRRSKTAR